jgi:parallel beta-helix repeat protein
MISVDLTKCLLSCYFVSAFLTAGFVGILVYEGVMDSGGVTAQTLYVGSQQTYTKIQEAIDDATEGDTVQVYAGTYYENVIVNKKLTLIGNGADNTIIDGSGNGDVINVATDWVEVSGFKITNSGSSSGDAGLELNNVQNCYIYYNTVDSNKEDGIRAWHSDKNTLENNICTDNNKNGIYLYSSSYNMVVKNTCGNNNNHGIFLNSGSYDNTLVNNTCSNNDESGIYLFKSSINTLMNNNCLNNKQSGIYLYSSSESKLMNSTCSANSGSGITLTSSSESNTLEAIICSNNGFAGISISSNSNDNVIINCSIFSNTYYDIYLSIPYSTTAINTKFNSIFVDSSSKLVVKNYLHIQVNNSESSPIQGADVEVKDGNKVIYASIGYGGANSQTNANGQIKRMLVTDRIYNGNTIPKENKTTVSVKYPGLFFSKNERNVNMSNQHFEYFNQNILPEKILLDTPVNNLQVRSLKPILMWYAGIDLDEDLLTYDIEIDESGGDWSTPIDSYRTSPDIFSWIVSTALIDGQHYQWRVRANDGYGTGPWSDIWQFTVNSSISATIIVDKGGTGNFKTIQDAIDAAAPDDVISVSAGIYNESLKINKKVTLIGNGSTATIINGGGGGDVIHVTADRVEISGFKITINKSSFGRKGIFLDKAHNCFIYNNNVSAKNYSVSLIYGIYLTSSSHNTLENNKVSRNRNGIHLDSSDSNTLADNTLSKNIIDGIGLDLSSRNILVNNKCLKNKNGITLASSYKNTLKNNNCSNNSFNGITLDSSFENTLVNNSCSKNTNVGIYLVRSYTNTLADNTCQNNVDGIWLYKSHSNSFVNDTCRLNSLHGISLDGASIDNTLMKTTCSNNANGIFADLSSSSNVIINCSTFLNSEYDIKLSGLSTNTAVNSTFSTIFVDSNAKLIVKNFMHMQIYDPDGSPLQGADVEVKDAGNVIYSSPGYGGIHPQTNAFGQIKWIPVTDRIYDGSDKAKKNSSNVRVKYSGLQFKNNPRDVKMSISHFEYFHVGKDNENGLIYTYILIVCVIVVLILIFLFIINRKFDAKKGEETSVEPKEKVLAPPAVKKRKRRISQKHQDPESQYPEKSKPPHNKRGG